MTNLSKKQNSSLRIEKVEGRRALRRFIHVPWSIYADDPVWVPPLIIERLQHLSSDNPYFEHAQYCSWIAYRGITSVGRISAQVDKLYIERYKDSRINAVVHKLDKNNGNFYIVVNYEVKTRSLGKRIPILAGPVLRAKLRKLKEVQLILDLEKPKKIFIADFYY